MAYEVAFYLQQEGSPESNLESLLRLGSSLDLSVDPAGRRSGSDWINSDLLRQSKFTGVTVEFHGRGPLVEAMAADGGIVEQRGLDPQALTGACIVTLVGEIDEEVFHFVQSFMLKELAAIAVLEEDLY